MPCMHEISAIASKNKRYEEYCHGWLTMGAYRVTYEHFIKPTHSQNFWEKIDYEAPVPPLIKRSVGRPKKQKRRDVNEDSTNATRLKRSYADVICSRCGHSNHNIRKCTNKRVPQKPKNWVAPAPLEPQTINNDPQTGPDEVDLSQGVPTADFPESQPNNTSPKSNIIRGKTSTRPPIRDRNLKNPPYRPPGTVPRGLRRKMNTMRPPTVTHPTPLEAAHHNSTTPQLQLQP
ncbi:hypothetical protein SESBI_31105 [Sesbania bispinosa]|nr:hypothetical protein SESBI_31105 [Sesbania bispinosa]